MRFGPSGSATEHRLEIKIVGNPSRSNSRASVAPPRVPVPHVTGEISRVRYRRVLTQPAWQIPFCARRAHNLTAADLEGQSGQARQHLAHAGNARGRRHSVEVEAGEVDAGIFRMHGRHCREAQRLLCQPAYLCAGQSIASGIEGRPGNDQIWATPLQKGFDLRQSSLRVFAHEVITADDGGDDLRLALPMLLQGFARADGASHGLQRGIGLIFTAKSPEELIHVMHDADHLSPLFSAE